MTRRFVSVSCLFRVCFATWAAPKPQRSGKASDKLIIRSLCISSHSTRGVKDLLLPANGVARPGGAHAWSVVAGHKKAASGTGCSAFRKLLARLLICIPEACKTDTFFPKSSVMAMACFLSSSWIFVYYWNEKGFVQIK